MNYFNELPLSPSIQRALQELGYVTMTPIQQLAIPLMLEGTSIIAKAETGSGKTAAYSIPMIEQIDWLENKPQGLVIAPNRELAIQIAEDINHIGRYKRIKALPIYGRASIKEQTLALKQKNHIISGTPGRLMDLIEKGVLNLDKLRFLIIDEADELLQEEFLSQLELVFQNLPTNCIISLFSATISEQVERISHLHDTAFTFIDATMLDTLQIQEFTYHSIDTRKPQDLLSLLALHPNQGGIIFTGTKIVSEKVCKVLRRANISASFIHADLEQRKRIQHMNEFKTGKYLFLVATDLSARGIDVDGIDLVINYDLPTTPANYTHRIGRIGRNGRSGTAINLVTPEQMVYLKRIENLTEKDLTPIDIPTSYETPTNTQSPVISRSKKGSNVGTDITRLYINGGKRKKLRAADIVGTLCSIHSITPDDIGIIEIKENETYVELLNGKGNLALTELREKTIKGRKYKVHIAK
ncbi:MAG: DEAD/DEAH box helicase [Eubacteriales bacterium]